MQANSKNKMFLIIFVTWSVMHFRRNYNLQSLHGKRVFTLYDCIKIILKIKNHC